MKLSAGEYCRSKKIRPEDAGRRREERKRRRSQRQDSGHVDKPRQATALRYLRTPKIWAVRLESWLDPRGARRERKLHTIWANRHRCLLISASAVIQGAVWHWQSSWRLPHTHDPRNVQMMVTMLSMSPLRCWAAFGYIAADTVDPWMRARKEISSAIHR